MFMIDQTERLRAYQQLLSLPDEPMMRRRHYNSQIGAYTRRATVLLPLLARWAANRVILLEEGERR
jgi:hypothetical protein